MKGRILVVDDEIDIVNMIKLYFEKKGYKVLTSCNGRDAIKKVEKEPNLILLDVSMPKMDGLEVCQRIRDYVSCPIVFLSAKVEEVDRIKGLAAGGDDYILKPFSLLELDARVEAHLRRETRVNSTSKLKFMNELTINYTEKEIIVAKTPISLTKKEYEIIELLSTHSGQTFEREHIYEKIWGYDTSSDSHVVVEHIRRIRKKISFYSDISYIETIWGVGYKWIK